ncbi:peroxidase family protein [Roseiconus sp. JC912]|uniref:peroxidase family protein n=1 Tax=Roseiconus sp. JC912 TaxID=3396307 RepID=UPI003A4C7C6E
MLPKTVRRKLCAEKLGSRILLAADFRHNFFQPEDVNDDGKVSPSDALAVINAMSGVQFSASTMYTDVDNNGEESPLDALMVINRLALDSELATGNDASDLIDQMPSLGFSFRTYDGSDNNATNPLWGSAGTEFRRNVDAAYADSIGSPTGTSRPSPREISNTLSAEFESGTPSRRSLSPFVYVWGQFLDHDITLSGEPGPEDFHESFDIKIPTDDVWFNPMGRTDVTMPFTRSAAAPGSGTSSEKPRQQINEITSFIDGSQIYGSNKAVADSLREFVGGRLLIRENGLLPVDEMNQIMAGDKRAAENIGLTAMHTLFVREHNRIAKQLAEENPSLDDEELYQCARAIVTAELQSITYNEFLPALLGTRGIKPYLGYSPEVDPTITNEFATAAFRFGHSAINRQIRFIGNDGHSTAEAVSLTDAFFNPSILDEAGIDEILKFDASTVSMEIDLEVIDPLRNFLFGPPGAGGLDLVSLNIQRGRDHGIADYNQLRVAYGLPAVTGFAEITSDVELQVKLESLYHSVDDIDAWVGIMAEDHRYGASVGELASRIIADQFRRLREGDRSYYENVFSRSDIRMIERTTLADIIERNTDVTGLQTNVFFFRSELSGTVSSQSDSLREGLQVILLDSQGEFIADVQTDASGVYRFDSFPSTGSYKVILSATDTAHEVNISTGNLRFQGLDFEIA